MSKIGKPTSSKGAIPKQFSASKAGGKSAQKGKGGKAEKGKKEADKKDVIEWQLPAFSIPPQRQKQDINWEKLKKETARRHSPEGEDIKEIRRILREIKGRDVPIHEFINMVGAYTSDSGVSMRSVMAEDLESFRKLAKKVYETMTQDVSDVLVNEQLQMVQYYEEKNSILGEKMMRSINEIYEMAPDFDFEKFLRDKDDYLQSLFPLPREAEMMSDEAFEMVRRQQAYHRLQWLRSEGERMSVENKRLMRRLEELKTEQHEEQTRAADLAAEAETKRQQLSQEENQMKDKLEKLNESIEKSFIRDELQMTQEHNRTVMEQRESETDATASRKRSGAVRKTRSGAGLKKPPSRQRQPQWSSTTAADIEDEAAKSMVAMETAKKEGGRTGTVKRPKSRAAKQTSPFHYSPPQSQDEPPFTSTQMEDQGLASFGRAKSRKPARPPSPFHYSPPKTPPQERGPASQMEEEGFVSFGKARPKKQAKPPSPFHYSPPKSPPQDRREEDQYGAFGQSRSQKRSSPFHYSPPKSPVVQETRIEEATTTVQQKRAQPRVRQTMAPKDTWGGFF